MVNFLYRKQLAVEEIVFILFFEVKDFLENIFFVREENSN